VTSVPEPMAATRLADRIGEAGAARAWAPRWGLSGSTAAPVSMRFEHLYLPVAIGWPAAAALDPPRRSGAVEARESRMYVVERVLGHGWTIALSVESATDVGSEWTTEAGVCLSARLELTACQRPLDALATRAAFAIRRGRTAIAPVSSVRAAMYPFWLRYRRGRGGRLPFDALDAVTGRRAGGPLRAAIAAALIDANAG
jgi:hypothetical protein